MGQGTAQTQGGILRDQLALTGAQGLRLGMGLFATILLMRGLPDGNWAAYVLVATGLALALQVVDAGLGGPLVAALARPEGDGGFRRRVGRVRLLLAIGALILGLGGWLKLGLGSDFGRPELALGAAVLLGLAVVAAPLRSSASALVARRCEIPRAGMAVFSQALFLGLVILGAVAWRLPPEKLLLLAVAGLGLRELISSLGLALFEYARALRGADPSMGETRSGSLPPRLGPVLLASAVGALYLNADVFIVSWLGGETEVARYGDASRLASPLFVLPALVISPLTRVISQGSRDRVLAAALVAATPLIPGLCALAAAADPIFSFVRDRAAPESAAAFRPLALAGVGVVAGQVGALALHARGLSATWARIAVLGLVANVGLDVVLVPIWGAKGAACATLATELAVGFLALRLGSRAAAQTGSSAPKESTLPLAAPRAIGRSLGILVAWGVCTALLVAMTTQLRADSLWLAVLVGAFATGFALFMPELRRWRQACAEEV